MKKKMFLFLFVVMFIFGLGVLDVNAGTVVCSSRGNDRNSSSCAAASGSSACGPGQACQLTYGDEEFWYMGADFGNGITDLYCINKGKHAIPSGSSLSELSYDSLSYEKRVKLNNCLAYTLYTNGALPNYVNVQHYLRQILGGDDSSKNAIDNLNEKLDSMNDCVTNTCSATSINFTVGKQEIVGDQYKVTVNYKINGNMAYDISVDGVPQVSGVTGEGNFNYAVKISDVSSSKKVRVYAVTTEKCYTINSSITLYQASDTAGNWGSNSVTSDNIQMGLVLNDYNASEKLSENETYITYSNMYGNLTINKKDQITGKLVGGSKFQLYTDSSCSKKYGNEMNLVNGSASAKLVAGTYYYKEIQAPDNYAMKSLCKKVEVKANETSTKDEVNMPLGKLIIKKTDRNGKVLAGAQFELWYSPDGKDYERVTTSYDFGYSNIKGSSFVVSKLVNGVTKYYLKTEFNSANTGTNSSGVIDIKGLPYGYYKIVEAEAPIEGNQGYKVISEPILVKIDKSLVNKTIVNNPMDIKIVKVGLDDEGNVVKRLTGARFEITTDIKSDIWADLTVTDSNGIVQGIKPGVYTVREVESPSGYANKYNEIKIEVKSDGTITVLSSEDGAKVYNIGEINDFGETVSSNPQLVFYNVPSNVKISKQDIANSKELPGAKLELTCGDEVKSWISTDTPKEVYIEDDSTCSLREVIAPDGYEQELNNFEFKYKSGKITSVTNLSANSNFKIDNDKIIFYNGLKVPNTANTVSIIAIIFGIMLIGGGTYIVFKNTKNRG